ncbi:ABC transporter ATP-binding protein [Paenibacillus algicola]|uniref:Carnitine transport ATP-binding protein OpuCA n=1 Tax=Paenibacillus algicola TaxID=2565926 RepID=A0A4P8XPP0_9BACL|nr:ABC transporter ATP-binding protein [Paenibacillus algicola]QCT03750.1 ABC transporter ATP-binding protein [Paenibacillus algicola]
MSIVEIEQLTFSYARAMKPVIQELSLVVEQGEIVGIVGSSGNGKSTLLRLIAGLEAPDSGVIRINGVQVNGAHTFVQPEHRGVGMVSQDYALFPHMNVRSNIAFGLHKQSRKERAQRVAELLELIRMEGFEDRYPHELSGGQQQRVALARTMAPRPNVVLMDEPFSSLDAELKHSIRRELRDIVKAAQMTCLFVTHDQADVEAMSDRYIRLCKPQLVTL